MATLDLDAIKRAHSLPGIAAAAGLKLLRAGKEWKACCPFHGDRTPSFTIYQNGERWCCFGGCGEGDVFDFLAKLHGIGLRDAAAMLTGGTVPSIRVEPPPTYDKGDRVDEARTIWRAAQSITGTPAETYLRSRCLHLALPDCLRFARLRYGKSGPLHPVLVAAIASADNRLTGIQRTYLNQSGTGKAAVPKAKLSLGRVSGGAIRLTPSAASLVVCEGLEDGLSLQQELGQAVWVAAGASMLPAMQFKPGVRSIVIGADNDEAGEAAAIKAADAFASRGLSVRIIRPLPGHKDFNAELQGKRA